jgi:hypothetical protein
MLSLEGQQVAYVAEWWRSTVKTWIDGSYRTTIERHFITDFIAIIAVSLNLPLLEFNVNAKNVICQFLVFDGCFRDFRAKRFIMVDPRKGVKRWYGFALVFGTGKPKPADSVVGVFDEGVLQSERAFLESGKELCEELCIGHIEVEASRVDNRCLSAVLNKVDAAGRQRDRVRSWSWSVRSLDATFSVPGIRVDRRTN